jgi:hypothetical protein
MKQAETGFNRCTWFAYSGVIWLKIVSIKASKAVIDGGTLKHDQSY